MKEEEQITYYENMITSYLSKLNVNLRNRNSYAPEIFLVDLEFFDYNNLLFTAKFIVTADNGEPQEEFRLCNMPISELDKLDSDNDELLDISSIKSYIIPEPPQKHPYENNTTPKPNLYVKDFTLAITSILKDIVIDLNRASNDGVYVFQYVSNITMDGVMYKLKWHPFENQDSCYIDSVKKFIPWKSLFEHNTDKFLLQVQLEYINKEINEHNKQIDDNLEKIIEFKNLNSSHQNKISTLYKDREKILNKLDNF